MVSYIQQITITCRKHKLKIFGNEPKIRFGKGWELGQSPAKDLAYESSSENEYSQKEHILYKLYVTAFILPNQLLSRKQKSAIKQECHKEFMHRIFISETSIL